MKKCYILSVALLALFVQFCFVSSFAAYDSGILSEEVELINGDFEDETPSGWSFYAVGTEIEYPENYTNEDYSQNDTSNYYNIGIVNMGARGSSKCLSLYDAGNGGEAYAYSVPYPVVPGESLSFQFDARKEYRMTLGGSNSAGYVALYFSANEDFQLPPASIPTTYRTAIGDSFTNRTWTTSRVLEYTVPDNVNYVRIIAYGLKPSGTHIYFDNFSLSRSGSKKISDPKFTDGTGNTITVLPQSGNLSISTQITSTYFSDLPVIMMSGLYNAEGELIQVDTQNNYHQATKSSTLSATMVLPEDGSHQECRVLIFGIVNGRIETYMPVTTLRK